MPGQYGMWVRFPAYQALSGTSPRRKSFVVINYWSYSYPRPFLSQRVVRRRAMLDPCHPRTCTEELVGDHFSFNKDHNSCFIQSSRHLLVRRQAYWMIFFVSMVLQRQRYPKLTENRETDVVIIGGGITGLSIAYNCLKRGRNPVLVLLYLGL